jgi:hypothetical protein
MIKQDAAGKLHSWAGWIPTVSGQLSFSIIGHSSAAKNCAFVNETPPGTDSASKVRHIILHQNRTAPDFPYWNFLTRLFYPGAVYDFVCVASTAEAEIQVMLPPDPAGNPRVKGVENAQGVLQGKIHVMLRERIRRVRKRNLSFIKRLKTSIWQARADDIAQAAAIIGNRLAGQSSREEDQSVPPLLVADFSLYRTGEFRLTVDETAWSLIVTEGPNQETDLENLFDTIPNQIFFFMKDVVHRHYHHDGSSDQMLSLSRQDGDFGEHEIGWRRRTLWGLVRVIMQYRRAGHWPDLQKAKGVAAYAEAFQVSFANCVRKPSDRGTFEETTKLSTYDLKHLRDSIEVSIAENTAGRSAVWQWAALTLPTVLAVMLAVSAYGTKLLSQRLAACSPAKDSQFWSAVRHHVNCDNVSGAAMTFWESLTTNHTTLVVAGLLVSIAVFAEHFLLDVPFAKSLLGRKLHSARSTIELLSYAIHTQFVLLTRSGWAWVRWLARQVAPVLLVFTLVVEWKLLIWLLQQL